MNRIGEILKEIQEIQAQRGQLKYSDQELGARTQVLTDEWQGLCQHPEEYVDQEQVGNTINTICRACSKILDSEQEDED